MTNEPTNEEIKKSREEMDAEFDALLRSPISEEDARKALADIDVRKMQLMVIRQKWQTQVTQTQMNIAALDEKIFEIDMEKAVIFRRAINKTAPEMKVVEKGE